MKDRRLLFRICILLMGLPGPASPEASSPLQIRVELQQGERITGEPLPQDPNSLLLQPYWLDRPLEIRFPELTRFERLGPAPVLGEGRVRIRFPSGGHWMLASLKSADNGDYIGGSLWGGQVALPRDAVSGMEFLNPEGFVYYGPRVFLKPDDPPRLREVELPRPGRQWQTEPIQFPDRFQLEIEMEPAAKDFVYHISLFDWQRSQGGGSVVFEVSDERISAAWYKQTTRNRMNVENWREVLEEGSSPRRFQLFVNLPENRITLFLDNREIHTWDQRQVGTLRANHPFSLNFRYLSGTGSLSVKSIRVNDWDGDLPAPGRYTGRDLILLKNGKQISGRLQRLSDLEATVLVGKAEEPRTIALHRISKVELNPGGETFEAFPPEDSARLFISGKESGGHPVNVRSLGNGQLKGEVWTGATAFDVDIPLQAVRRIEFPQRDPQ